MLYQRLKLYILQSNLRYLSTTIMSLPTTSVLTTRLTQRRPLWLQPVGSSNVWRRCPPRRSSSFLISSWSDSFFSFRVSLKIEQSCLNSVETSTFYFLIKKNWHFIFVLVNERFFHKEHWLLKVQVSRVK